MLRTVDLLEEIYREEELNVDRLARRFATSRDQIQQAIVSLKDQGYLVEEMQSGGAAPSWVCRFCPMKTYCKTGNSRYGLKMYQITEKGERVINSMQGKDGNQ